MLTRPPAQEPQPGVDLGRMRRQHRIRIQVRLLHLNQSHEFERKRVDDHSNGRFRFLGIFEKIKTIIFSYFVI